MVRATFAGYTTALSALQANQKRLDITGQNLSNMNTPGYTRQQLKVSSVNYTNPISHYLNDTMAVVGYGVSMDAVTQIRDPYLDAQYRNQIQKSGYTDSIQTALDRLANVFDESHITGIRKAFDNILSTLDNMQDPAKVTDAIYDSELRNRMQALTNALNNASLDLTKAEQDELRKLDGTGVNDAGDIQNVNNILQQIGQLNRNIKNGQIAGMDCLELMDERNLLLDELASYIPIEVTYYKDAAHDGLNSSGDPAMAEEYYLDGQGHVVGRRDWPDDLRVEMVYKDSDGKTQKLTLVEGTIGEGDDNYGKLKMTVSKEVFDKDGNPALVDKDGNPIPFDKDGNPILPVDKDGNPVPVNHTFEPYWDSDDKTAVNIMDFSTSPMVSLEINGLETYDASSPISKQKTIDFTVTINTKSDPNNPDETITTGTIGNHFASGSVQAKLDMLWQDGTTDGISDVRGYEFYRNQLDNLAKAFANVMNKLNIEGTVGGKDNSQYLLANKTTDGQPNVDGTVGITAANIGVSKGWINGDVHVSTTDIDGDGNNNDTVLRMIEAMKAAYTKDGYTGKYFKIEASDLDDIDLKNNSFSEYINYTSTILANDSYSNAESLKNNVTVLNGIQNSRDSFSGISLDEEASNMMMYISAYNAASRLMTTLDEALNTLINNTGLVGR